MITQLLMITQERLKEVLEYDPDTGIFRWKVKRRGRFVKEVGAIAGTTKGRYVRICIDGRQYAAHRLAWYMVFGYWPKEIDHINQIKIDNRLENLRECNRSENTGNVGLRVNNKTGFRGIWFAKHCCRWRAGIKQNGKLIHIGYFNTPQEAARAYDEYAKEHFGEFAYLNNEKIQTEN